MKIICKLIEYLDKSNKLIENKLNCEINSCYICYEDVDSQIISSCGCKIYVHSICYYDWINKKNICIICREYINMDIIYTDIVKITKENILFVKLLLKLLIIKDYIIELNNEIQFNCYHIEPSFNLIICTGMFFLIILPMIIINYIITIMLTSIWKLFIKTIEKITEEIEFFL